MWLLCASYRHLMRAVVVCASYHHRMRVVVACAMYRHRICANYRHRMRVVVACASYGHHMRVVVACTMYRHHMHMACANYHHRVWWLPARPIATACVWWLGDLARQLAGYRCKDFTPLLCWQTYSILAIWFSYLLREERPSIAYAKKRRQPWLSVFFQKGFSQILPIRALAIDAKISHLS